MPVNETKWKQNVQKNWKPNMARRDAMCFREITASGIFLVKAITPARGSSHMVVRFRKKARMFRAPP